MAYLPSSRSKVLFVCAIFFAFSGLLSTTACGPGPRIYDYQSIVSEFSGGASLGDKSRTETFVPAMRPGTPEPPASPLTLDDAVVLALRNNPDRHQTMARVLQSRAMLEDAESRFWPRLRVYTEYIQGDAPSSYLFKTIDARRLPSRTDFNDPGWFENYETGIEATVNLFRGGRDVLAQKMAKEDIRIQELGKEGVENELVATIIDGYFTALSSGNLVEIAGESVEVVKKQLELTEVRFKAGGVLKSDVLSLQVRLARAREKLVGARSRHEKALAGLAVAMGLDPGKKVVLDENPHLALELPSSYEDGLAHALNHRPELAELRRRLVKSRMALDVARSRYLPTLDAVSSYYFDDPHFDYDMERENWIAGLTLNWEIFTGFSRQARVRKAKAVIGEMIAADRKATNEISLDTKRAYLNLQEAEARVRVTETAVDQAKESLELVRVEYEGGSSGVVRYLNAQLAWEEAMVHELAARYARECARADLARALGYWADTGRWVP